jgi:hypothetical protein
MKFAAAAGRQNSPNTTGSQIAPALAPPSRGVRPPFEVVPLEVSEPDVTERIDHQYNA